MKHLVGYNMAYSCLLSLGLRSTFLLFCLHYVLGDVYMHNPRGSNDRLNTKGQNRQNANRLFDSQNNAKGGYNVGELPYTNGGGSQDQQYAMKYFMSGSKYRSSRGLSHLAIEWTNQHGCGHGDLDCNIVLQYMCQDNRYESLDDFSRNKDIDTIRNGRIETTIGYTAVNINSKRQKNDQKRRQARLDRGMHEPWEWHDKCRKRQRNQGLFTADQNMKDNIGSTSTRQNPNGNRHGYECPEERDYYPYWHPTDWKDIAVYVTNKEHCAFYEHFSFNRHPKGECLERYPGNEGFKHYSQYNNPTECRQRGSVWILFHNFIDFKDEYKDKASCESASTEDVPLVWGVPYRSEFVDALEIDKATNKPKEFCLVQPPKVDCRLSPLSRPNHLGNVKGAQSMNYTWIIPYFSSQVEKRCVVRIRYNISTHDYDGNRTFSDKNGNNSPVKNDPEVEFQTESGRDNFKLQLAVNTAQFGRTFQDRSHVMFFMPRQSNGNNIADDVAVYNLNVRGKRGNIVQVYPAVEYDFVPNDLSCTSNDVVHIQWTGSTRNPGNNDGEGTAGTDKSNLVEIDDSGINVKFKENGKMISDDTKLIYTPDKRINSMEDVRVALATSGFDFSGGKQGRLGVRENQRLTFQDQLNNSPASYSVALSFSPGSYKYTCTRNNNFSNRNQKGSITVSGSSNASTRRRTRTTARPATRAAPRAATTTTRRTTRATTTRATTLATTRATTRPTTRPTTTPTPRRIRLPRRRRTSRRRRIRRTRGTRRARRIRRRIG